VTIVHRLYDCFRKTIFDRVIGELRDGKAKRVRGAVGVVVAFGVPMSIFFVVSAVGNGLYYY